MTLKSFMVVTLKTMLLLSAAIMLLYFELHSGLYRKAVLFKLSVLNWVLAWLP